MRTIITGFIFLISFLACESRMEPGATDRHSGETEMQRYLSSTPDAPLDFYCEVNNTLDSETRVAICNIVTSRSPILSADMLIQIKSHQIDTLEVVIFSFDKNGNRTIEHLDYDLNTMLSSLSMSNLLTFSILKDGPYLARLQLERFCNGYVTDVSLGDETARNLIEKGNADE